VNDEARIGRGVMAALVAGLFASGAASLVFELVIARSLAVVLGSGAWSRGLVLSTFLLGLAIGSAVGGRYADRLGPRALRGWAVLEAVVAAGIAASPWITRDLGAWVATATRTIPDGVGLDVVRLLAAASVVLVPSVAMGATLPMIVRGLAEARDADRTVPTLYAANTAGAACGVMVGATLLVPRLGVDGALYVAAGLEFGVAILAAVLAMRLTTRVGGLPLPADAALEPHADDGVDPDALDGLDDTLVAQDDPTDRSGLIAAAVLAGTVGAISLALQVLWTRWFGIVFGSSGASFAIVLTVVLVGLALGGALVAGLGARRATLRRWASLALVGSGAWLALTLVVSERLPWWQQQVLVGLEPDPAAWPWLLAWQALVAGAWMIPVTVATGATLPALVVLVAPTAEHAGRRVGTLFAANTVGTVIAPLIVLFGVLPAVGLQASLRGAVVALVLAGLALGWRGSRPPRRALVALAAGAVLVAAIAPSWRPGVVHAGTFRRPFGDPPGSWAAFVVRYNHPARLVYDGPEDSVYVGETASGVRFLKVNGKADASLGDDVLTQRYLAHVPLAIHAASAEVHEHPRRVFVLGVGSGQTAAAAAMHDRVDVTAVDISAGVLRALPWFVDDTPDAARLDGVDLRRGDARFVLQRDRGLWDVIVSEPSNPWVAGNAALFSQNFFTEVRGHLRPDGVFAQWMHLYATDAEVLALVIDTVRSVFDDVSVWIVGPVDIVLVARVSPHPIDTDRLADLLSDPAGPFATEPGAVDSVTRFFALQMATDADLDARPMGPVHTDRRPRLDAIAPRALFVGGLPDELVDLDRRRDPTATALALGARRLTDDELADLLGFVDQRDTPLIPHLAASVAYAAAERGIEVETALEVLDRHDAGPPSEVAAALDRVLAAPSLDACRSAADGVRRRLVARSSAWARPDTTRFVEAMDRCASVHADERATWQGAVDAVTFAD